MNLLFFLQEKQLQPSRFSKNVAVIDVNDLISGVYFLVMQQGQSIATKRFMVED